MRSTIGARADGSPIDVGITRVHMEEDAGKSIHDRFPGVTAIDLNRAGVPLIEIVSEPDMRSAARGRRVPARRSSRSSSTSTSATSTWRREASASTRTSARARRGETKLGTKTEVKNMNSFSGVERALEVEFARQCAVLDAGGTVEQQTMLWDAHAARSGPRAPRKGATTTATSPSPIFRR